MKSNVIICLAILAIGLVSCNEEYFDNDRYVSLVTEDFPVENVDAEHDWRTVRTVTATVDLSASPTGTYTLGVFDSNPNTGSSNLLTSVAVNGSATFKFDVPIAVGDQVYLLAVGTSQVALNSFYTISSDNTLSVASTGESTGAASASDYDEMEYTFCFEDNFPSPDDYDYNDLVAGVKMEKLPAGAATGDGVNDVIKLKVTLRALGTTKHIGACMRLVGLNAGVLQPEYTTEGTFYNNPLVTYTTIVPDNTRRPTSYFTALNGSDQCIVLFNDGHYAINGGVDLDRENFGVRIYYNTVKDTTYVNFMDVVEQTNEYTITFNGSGSQEFNNFTPSDIDLFMIESYNSGTYEVHTYPYKRSTVYHEWLTDNNAYTDNIPWAFMIPGNFKYAKEGTCIGSYATNVLGGAYQIYTRSFGEWARDHTRATNWYNYPASAMIYK